VKKDRIAFMETWKRSFWGGGGGSFGGFCQIFCLVNMSKLKIDFLVQIQLILLEFVIKKIRQILSITKITLNNY
jgi:hypothetical protein